MKALGTLCLALLAVLAAPPAARADGGLSIQVKLGPHAIGVHHKGSQKQPAYVRYGAPAPKHASKRVWIPGHYELVEKRVWVPGCTRKVWIEPIYETCYDACGKPYTVLVQSSAWKVVVEPGHWESRTARVWRSGCWRLLS